MNLTEEEFQLLAKFCSDHSGIIINDEKKYLVENRMAPLLKKYGCTTVKELYHMAEKDPSNQVPKTILETLSIKETSFFRDTTPFELLTQKLIPDAIDRRGSKRDLPDNPIKIWSAGCSTGQEAYSMAMATKELLPEASPSTISIVASDILESVLNKAKTGLYTDYEVNRGLSQQRQEAFFTIEDGNYRVNADIRGLISFHQFNLLGSWPKLPAFDIIFCRNVALYFAPENRNALFNQMADQLAPGGVLVASASERVHLYTDHLHMRKHCDTIYYQKGEQDDS